MDAILHLPNDAQFLSPMAGQTIAPVYSGEAMILLIDLRYVSIAPVEPSPNPPPPPPVETELYKVVSSGRLNVRVDHSTTSEIKDRLDPGEEFAVEMGAVFDADITWRKIYLIGYWVAIERGGAVYAAKVDTSTRGG